MNKKSNGQSLFKIALRNIRAYLWMNAKLCFTFACLAFLICLFTAYNSSINERRDTVEHEKISSNYICTQTANTYNSFKEIYVDGIAHEDKYKAKNFATEIKKLYGWAGNELYTSYITLMIDNEEYHASTKYSNISISCVTDPEDGFFYEYDNIELKQRFGKDGPYIAGNRPLETNEIAISENVLEAFELTPSDVMGKEISVYLKPKTNDESKSILLFAAKTSGVIAKEVASLTGRKSISSSHPGFLFNLNNALFNSKYNTVYRMYLNFWPNEEMALEWLEKYGGAYVGTGSVKTINNLDNIKVLGGNLYVIIGCALFIGLILTIVLMIDKYVKVFSRFGGIMLTLGLKQNRLSTLLFVQLLLLCIIAIPVAFVLTYVGYEVITGIITMVTNISLYISIAQLLALFIMAIGIVVAIAMTVFVYMILRLRRKTIKQLLVTVTD